MTPRPSGGTAVLPSAAETARPVRAPVGSAREMRARLTEQRRPPLLVSLYADVLGETGLLGPPARLRIARWALRGVPAVIAAGGAFLVARRFYAEAPLEPEPLAALGVVVATTGVVAWRLAVVSRDGRSAGWRRELELGALLLVLASTVAQGSGAFSLQRDEPLQPLVYLVVALLVATLARGPAIALGVAVVGFEAIAWWSRGAAALDLPPAVGRSLFVLAFGGLHHAVLGARVAAGRRAEKAALDRRRQELDERSRQLRLLAGSEPIVADTSDGAERLGEAVVLETDAAARSILEIAEAIFGAHTAAVWLLSDDDRELHLWECRSASECVARRLPAGDGPLGVVVKRRAAVRLEGDVKGANHYDDGSRPRALLAVPLLARVGGHLRGVVLVDRATPAPFAPEDEVLLQKLAEELARASAAERLIHDGRATRAEQERFYQAMERLNRTTTPRDVFDAVIDVAAGMVEVDFAAVTLVEGAGAKTRHRVCRAVVSGVATAAGVEGAHGGRAFQGAPELEGKEFADNGGLVSCSVRLASALPAKPIDLSEAVVFDEATRVKGLASLKVLPLRSAEAVLGSLVVGSKSPSAYGRDAVRQLEAVAMQAGDSILRARLFEATERLATTDGLTGLVNHRTFQARLDEHLAAAQRYGKKLSLLLTDIDHFKKVNDTYGHPVGDVVLREVAKILQKEARTTDIAARYGGEEFAVVMPETDLAGAIRTAERIRERVAMARFATEQGELQVRLSIGVATFPADAPTKAQLIARADGGLYHAKRHGRNQTIALSTLRKR